MRTVKYDVYLNDISPKNTRFAGIQGESRVTQLEFTLMSDIRGALNSSGEDRYYRVDITDGAGGFHSSATAAIPDTALSGGEPLPYEISDEITGTGGECRIFLVITGKSSSDGAEKVLYSFPARIWFERSSFGSSSETEVKKQITGAVLEARDCASQAENFASQAEWFASHLPEGVVATGQIADGAVGIDQLAIAVTGILNSAVTTGSVTNLDALETPGIYYMSGTISGTLPPGEGNGAVIVFRGVSNMPYQFWSGKQSYIRKNIGGGTSGWDAWIGGVPNGSISAPKLAADVKTDINSRLKYTRLVSDTNIDNLYGPENYGAYYPPYSSAGGTYPPGETALNGILFVFDSGGNWDGQVWIGKKCYYRLNHSTSEPNWDAWSTYDISDKSVTLSKLDDYLIERIDSKQNEIDNRLPTTAKTVVGAIAEVRSRANDTYTKQQSDNRFANAVIASKSGNPATLSDVQAGAQFKAVTVRGVTTESGTGDKSPDNPYALSGVTNPAVTVNSVAYPTTTSTLYGLPNGVEDTIDLVSGVETHRIDKLIIDGVTAGKKFALDDGYQTQGYNYAYFTTLSIKPNHIPICSHAKYLSGFLYVKPGVWATSVLGLTLPDTLTGITSSDTVAQRVQKINDYCAAQYAAGTPVTVLYQLATPTTTQRTAQTIPASSPNSTITSAAGNLTVQYNQDIAGALALKANKAQEDWITPTLVNGWIPSDGFIVGYRKDNFGRVWLRGQVRGGTSGTIILQLPEGYRPTTTINSIVLANNAMGSVYITSAGNLVFSAGNPAWVSLQQVSFYVGQ